MAKITTSLPVAIGAAYTSQLINNGADGINEYITLLDLVGVDKNFVFIQGLPSTTWSVTHNLGKFPSVTITDSAGTEYEGEVQHIDNNSLVLWFSAAFSGQAIMN